ncbi:hypothetical protein Bca101_035990 [Brassica carinata]
MAVLWINERNGDFVVAWAIKQFYIFSYKKITNDGDKGWSITCTRCEDMAYKDNKLYVYTYDHYINVLDFSGNCPKETLEGNHYLNHPFPFVDTTIYKMMIAIANSGEFRKRCPRNKGGIIWYDQCFLWVSEIGESMSIKTNYKNIFSMYNPNNVRWGAKLFAKRAMDFFSELTLKVKKNTEAGSIIILYAAGEKKLGKNTLYAMVQCVSLTIDCKSCLAWSITKLFKNGDIREGGRVLGMNCDVRYEIYPFLRS